MRIQKALAIKYRPQSFEDVVEQTIIKTVLTEQLKSRTFKNAYLFVGGAGTGKTTCARIFAHEINQGKGTPIEIDGASNNGVDNVREIIEKSNYQALDANYKIYIIDECHMLSNGAWNAMLKLIEEPPALTVFIFCTTDPQKIPATILSRVQRYDFKKISEQAIIKRLEFVLESEDIKSYEPEALFYISKIAAGGMRDALTLLDKCISYNQLLTIDNVTTVLGLTSYDILFNLTDYIMNNDTKNILLTIDEIDKKGIDLRQFISQYLQFTLDLQKYFILSDFTKLNIPDIYEPILKNWQQNGKRKHLLQLLDIIINLNDTIRYTNNIKTIIEATFLLFTEADK